MLGRVLTALTVPHVSIFLFDDFFYLANVHCVFMNSTTRFTYEQIIAQQHKSEH